MPVAQTYNGLLEDSRRYLERGFTAQSDPEVYIQLPRLITLAERRCARELKIQGFQNTVTSTFSAGLAVYDKPTRWRETISINVGTGEDFNERKTLYSRSYEYCRYYWPNQETQVDSLDDLCFYADYDFSHWLIAGTPSEANPWEILYYENPPFLDDANQTNWLTNQAPELILYGTLLEAVPFLKNDERVPTWQTMYDRAASAINGEDLQKILDRAAERSKP